MCNQVGHFARDCPVNKQNDIKEEKENPNSEPWPVKGKSNSKAGANNLEGNRTMLSVTTVYNGVISP